MALLQLPGVVLSMVAVRASSQGGAPAGGQQQQQPWRQVPLRVTKKARYVTLRAERLHGCPHAALAAAAAKEMFLLAVVNVASAAAAEGKQRRAARQVLAALRPDSCNVGAYRLRLHAKQMHRLRGKYMLAFREVAPGESGAELATYELAIVQAAVYEQQQALQAAAAAAKSAAARLYAVPASAPRPPPAPAPAPRRPAAAEAGGGLSMPDLSGVASDSARERLIAEGLDLALRHVGFGSGSADAAARIQPWVAGDKDAVGRVRRGFPLLKAAIEAGNIGMARQLLNGMLPVPPPPTPPEARPRGDGSGC